LWLRLASFSFVPVKKIGKGGSFYPRVFFLSLLNEGG